LGEADEEVEEIRETLSGVGRSGDD